MEKLVKQIINQYIAPYLTPPSKWPGPNNWALKALSLLFAIFLWYFVVGEDRVDTKIFIPIEIVNLPRNLVITNEFKKQLDVTIRGPRVLTRAIDTQRITRSVDLSEATPGKFVFSNNPDSIPFPRGIKVLRIQPQNITLLLDQLIKKELPIRAVTNGTPSPLMELVSVTLDPATISVTGPQAVLAKEEHLSTVTIDLTNIQTSTQKEIDLDLKEEMAELIGDPVITAKVVVREKTTERQITKIPIDFNGADDLSYRMQPSFVDIRAEIPISLINNKVDLHSLFAAHIETAGLPPGRHQLTVEVTPPKQVRILEITPRAINVRISSSPAKRRKATP